MIDSTYLLARTVNLPPSLIQEKLNDEQITHSCHPYF
jgi:hypothetical protein